MKKIEAYICDYCGYRNFLSNSTEEHEKSCCYNPGNKNCNSCLWFTWRYGIQIESGYCLILEPMEDDEDGVAMERSHCKKWVNSEIYDPNEWEEDGIEFITMLVTEPKKFLRKAKTKYKKRIEMRKESQSE